MITNIKRHKVQHSVDEYTFSTEAHIQDVRFDEKHMHVELMDQRVISIPLWWIPTLHNASDEDRNKSRRFRFLRAAIGSLGGI